MKFTNLIKKRRLELGLSQAKLARMLGYSNPQFICNIESGRSKMPKRKLRRLCRGLLLDTRTAIDAIMKDELNDLCKTLGLKIDQK